MLIFFSHLAEPIWAEAVAMLDEMSALADAPLVHMAKLWPRSWGGNVMVGNLWLVQDLIEGTAKWMDEHRLRPDVVIVSSTFLGPGGRDLVGRCYLEFERALDIQLRLLRSRLMDL